jgi:hypothetical protein
VGPADAAGTVDGVLVSVRAPHASCLLERVLGELDADLLVLEQLPERVTELGGVVKQRGSGVRGMLVQKTGLSRVAPSSARNPTLSVCRH